MPMSKTHIVAVMIISASLLSDAAPSQDPSQRQIKFQSKSHYHYRYHPQVQNELESPPDQGQPPPPQSPPDQVQPPPPQSPPDRGQPQPQPQPAPSGDVSQPSSESQQPAPTNVSPPPPQPQPQQPAPTNPHGPTKMTARQRRQKMATMGRDFIVAHNQVRARYNEPPLQWNKTLAQYTRRFANKRIADCKMIHSYGPYGENIFWGGRNHWTPTDVVDTWATEHKYYDKNTNRCLEGKMCGHYTQIVWRDTLRLGCARVDCNNGGVYAICAYDPPGNYIGESPFESRPPVPSWDDDDDDDTSEISFPPLPPTAPPPSPPSPSPTPTPTLSSPPLPL